MRLELVYLFKDDNIFIGKFGENKVKKFLFFRWSSIAVKKKIQFEKFTVS